MENDFNKCLDEFIVSRCAIALMESEECEKMQSGECSQEEILDTALIIGYKKGASDIIKVLLNCSQKL